MGVKEVARRRHAHSNPRWRELAKNHIFKKQLGLDDATYREMLFNVAGVRSAADLDERGRHEVLKHMKACGLRPVHKSAKASGMHIPAAPDRAPLLSKIGALLADMRLPWAYADGIAKQMYGVDLVRWLYPDQVRGVVAALIKRQQKIKTKGEAIHN